MLRLLTYLISKGVVTQGVIPQSLGDGVTGFPKVTEQPCADSCTACIESCPTSAIEIGSEDSVIVDRGACIACNQCIKVCPNGTLVNDPSIDTFAYRREDLLKSAPTVGVSNARGIFSRALSIRVVSTGCSACDLELSAASNPIFDMERFGINVVASPRFADALVVTGPVPKSMHEPLLSCYQAMPAPKLVVALGTCAISGGVHKNSYSEANGVGALLPVDVFVPGCPPHPFQIVKALSTARHLKGRTITKLP